MGIYYCLRIYCKAEIHAWSGAGEGICEDTQNVHSYGRNVCNMRHLHEGERQRTRRDVGDQRISWRFWETKE